MDGGWQKKSKIDFAMSNDYKPRNWHTNLRHAVIYMF